jgi:hypothetical protein
MDIRAEVAAWRERSKITFDLSDDAPAVQKFELPPPAWQPRTQHTPEELEEAAKNNGIWANPESSRLLITGQEMMNMTRGEVRALIAARRAGTVAPPDLALSQEGERFKAAAIELRDRVRTILSKDGYDPGPTMTFGMFGGTPRLSVDHGHGAKWIDPPNDEIGKMIVDLWKSQRVAAPVSRTA